MKIAIDISQIAHEGTGVSAYVRKMVTALITGDVKNEYVLFGASLRKRHVFSAFVKSLPRQVRLVFVPIPPTVLELLWNRLHIIPIEWFIGAVDIFWSSDWTQPPLSHARGVTTIHDLSFLRFPETFVHKITDTQKRRLERAKNICQRFFCDSEATKKDAETLLGIDKKKLKVVYPGYL